MTAAYQGIIAAIAVSLDIIFSWRGRTFRHPQTRTETLFVEYTLDKVLAHLSLDARHITTAVFIIALIKQKNQLKRRHTATKKPSMNSSAKPPNCLTSDYSSNLVKRS